MKKFETITEREILKSAYYSIFEKQDYERNLIEENPGKEMPIANHRMSLYERQLKEIQDRILELEKIS